MRPLRLSLSHIRFFLSKSVLVVALLLLLAGCASVSGPVNSPESTPSAELIPRLSLADRDVLLEEVSSLVFLAREQGRLGLTDDAAETWERAVARLTPHARIDGEVAERLGEVEAERELLLAGSLSLVERFGESAPGELDEEAALLVGPEPQLDLEHAVEVQEAARDLTPDWPVELNEQVLAWLEVYRKGGKLEAYIEGSIARSGKYEERFREIFAEEGIPKDLIYLAHVESGFKTSAYSRARARGIFQFISATGRRYGMRVDWWVDERADPEMSCRASATYLRDLYAEFGDWYLALAAYNAGEGRVRRSIRKAGTDDFWTLRRRHFFRRETRNYVPAIIAATIISKDPARFGYSDVVKEAPLQYETVTVPSQADLEVVARAAGVSAKTLRMLNPALRRGQTPPKYPNYQLKVPVGSSAGFDTKLAAIPRSEWIVKQLHRVKRGDTLSGVARRYGTTVRAIQSANSMGRRTMLSIGRVLEIPRGPGARRSYKASPARVAGDGSYRVRRGDTLGRIARRQHVSVQKLQAWNGLGRSTRINVGQRLYVRKPGSKSTRRAATRSSKRTSGSSAGVHVVRSGDSAWNISRQHNVSLSALLRANGLSKRSILRPGQRLVIPASPARRTASKHHAATHHAAARDDVHVVRRGDSLYKIARRYGVSVNHLRSVNNLAPNAIIHPGDRISIQ